MFVSTDQVVYAPSAPASIQVRLHDGRLKN